MAERVRAHDWSSTPLGPIDAWPPSLRTVVDLILANPVASILVCGPERVLIYNDACIALYGDKHPRALGMRGADIFPELWDEIGPLYDRVFAGERFSFTAQPWAFDRGAAGRVGLYDAYFTPCRGEDGGVAFAFVTAIEVTERARAQVALRESEARYRAFVTASSDVVYRMSPDWSQMLWLDGRGFLADSVEPSETWMEHYLHPDDRPAVQAAIEQAVRNKSLFELEHRVRRVDGSMGWTLSRAVPLLDENGDITEWLGAATDITGPRHAEEERRETEERQAFLLKLSDTLRPLAGGAEIQAATTRLLGEHLGVDRSMYGEVEGDPGAETGTVRGQYVRTSDGSNPPVAPFPERFTFRPFGAQTMARRYRGELLVVADIDAEPGFEPAERAAWVAAGVRAAIVAPLVKGGRLVAEFGVHSAAPRTWSPAEMTLIREVAERTWAATERARAESALRESEERQAFLLKLADALRPLVDPVEVMTVTSELLGRHLGVGRCGYGEVDATDEFFCVDRDWTDGVMPSFKGNHRLVSFGPDFTAAYREGRSVLIDDALADVRAEGAEAAFEAAGGVRASLGVPMIKEGRFVAGLYAQQASPRQWSAKEEALAREVVERTWDAVERARAEAALRQSEEKYRTIFDSIDEGFALIEVISDDEGKPVDLLHLETNPAYQRHTGLRSVVGKRALEIAPDFDGMWFDFYGEVARTGEAARMESLIPAVDRWITLHASRVGGEGSRKIAVVFNDITERKRAEAALRESEERQAFLLRLSDALRPLADPCALMAATSEMVGRHLGVGRCGYAEIDESGQILTVERDWTDGAMPSLTGTVRIDSFGNELISVYRSGQTLVIDDVLDDPRAAEGDPAAFEAIGGLRASIAVPLIKQDRWVSAFYVQQSSPRAWTAAEVELVQEIAERTWAAVERARAEGALRESEEKYRSVFDGIDEGFCIWEVVRDSEERIVDLRFLEVNPAFERQTGLSDVAGQLISEVAPGTEADWIETYGEVASTGATKRFEMYHDDTGRWYDIYASRLGGPDNPRVSIVFKDISERKRTEQMLRESEERQTFLLTLSDRLRTEADPRAIAMTSVSLLAEHMGLDRAYVAQVDKGRDVAEIGPEYRRPDLDPVEGDITLSNFPEAFARVEATTLVLADTSADPTLSDLDRRGFAGLRMGALIVASARKGTRNPVWALLVATERPRHWTPGEVALVEGVAERTWAAVERARAETAISDSEERLRAVVESLPGGAAFIVDSSLRYVLAGGEALAEAGLKPDDLVGRTIFEVLPPDVAADYESHYRGALAGESFEVEHTAHGLRLISRGVPLPDAQGKPNSVLVVSYDITARKEAEEALRESEERFRQFGEASSDVLWIRSADTLQWEYLSPAFETVYGESREEALAGDTMRSWAELLVPEDRDRAIGDMRRVFKGEQVTFEYRVRRPSDGEVRWLRNTDFPMVDETGRVRRIGGIGQDITEAKETQNRMQVLVAELQHRTRNLIAVVRGLADRTLQESPSLEDFQDRYGDRLKAVARVQALLSRLGEGERIFFDELLQAELKAHGALDWMGGRVTLDGPAGVRLKSRTVQTFALALHELATNAVKYGALSSQNGHLAVRWRVETDGAGRQLHVEWRETEVAMPADAAPQGGGYGRELIERALPYQLNAKTTYELRADGVFCTIAVPISEAVPAREGAHG